MENLLKKLKKIFEIFKISKNEKKKKIEKKNINLLKNKKYEIYNHIKIENNFNELNFEIFTQKNNLKNFNNNFSNFSKNEKKDEKFNNFENLKENDIKKDFEKIPKNENLEKLEKKNNFKNLKNFEEKNLENFTEKNFENKILSKKSENSEKNFEIAEKKIFENLKKIEKKNIFKNSKISKKKKIIKNLNLLEEEKSVDSYFLDSSINSKNSNFEKLSKIFEIESKTILLNLLKLINIKKNFFKNGEILKLEKKIFEEKKLLKKIKKINFSFLEKLKKKLKNSQKSEKILNFKNRKIFKEKKNYKNLSNYKLDKNSPFKKNSLIYEKKNSFNFINIENVSKVAFIISLKSKILNILKKKICSKKKISEILEYCNNLNNLLEKSCNFSEILKNSKFFQKNSKGGVNEISKGGPHEKNEKFENMEILIKDLQQELILKENKIIFLEDENNLNFQKLEIYENKVKEIQLKLLNDKNEKKKKSLRKKIQELLFENNLLKKKNLEFENLENIKNDKIFENHFGQISKGGVHENSKGGVHEKIKKIKNDKIFENHFSQITKGGVHENSKGGLHEKLKKRKKKKMRRILFF